MQAKQLCRAGIVSALYVALTFIFAPIAYGPFQLRPAEAFCILPLLFPESVLALFVGCVLTNLSSPFVLYDVCFGSLATLLAGVCTYLIGKCIKNTPLKIAVGGIFPVLFNALVMPFVIVVLYGTAEAYPSPIIAYFTYIGSLFFTQSVWVYGLGTPIYISIRKLQKKIPFLR